MPKPHVIDGIEVELDDDINPADLDHGEVSREDGEVDLDTITAQAEADTHLEDDEADPV